jgi:hypothetical protein
VRPRSGEPYMSERRKSETTPATATGIPAVALGQVIKQYSIIHLYPKQCQPRGKRWNKTDCATQFDSIGDECGPRESNADLGV